MGNANLKLCMKDLPCSCVEKHVQVFQCDCVLLVGCVTVTKPEALHLCFLIDADRPLCEVSRQSLCKQSERLPLRKGCDLSGVWGKLWVTQLSPFSCSCDTWGLREALSRGQQPIPQLHPPHLPHPVPPLLLTLRWPPTQPPAPSGNPHLVCVHHRSFHCFGQNHHCGHGFQVHHNWKRGVDRCSLILAFPDASDSDLARKSPGFTDTYTLNWDMPPFMKFCTSLLTRRAVISFYIPFLEPLLCHQALFHFPIFLNYKSLSHTPVSNRSFYFFPSISKGLFTALNLLLLWNLLSRIVKKLAVLSLFFFFLFKFN